MAGNHRGRTAPPETALEILQEGVAADQGPLAKDRVGRHAFRHVQRDDEPRPVKAGNDLFWEFVAPTHGRARESGQRVADLLEDLVFCRRAKARLWQPASG
ncbi:MAG: hypothetical protein HY904_16300 [Deltaproteobacteria bacterium]|nr:hypothetical protein [Deltaproteobacteria bacterium]